VIVVRGNADKIESVLAAIGVPHTVIEPTTLHTFKLSPEQTVYINCHPSYPAGSAQNVADFVHTGGQLITTDHVLTHLVQQAFPNTIRHSGGSTADHVIEIEINEAEAEDGVLKGFANEKTWWLAGGSHPVSVVDKKAVCVLIKGKSDSSPILVRFKHGDGTVYHMTSHFHLQQGQKPQATSAAAAPVVQQDRDSRANKRDRSSNNSNRSPSRRSPGAAASSSFSFSNPFSNMSNPFSRKKSGLAEPEAAQQQQVQQRSARRDEVDREDRMYEAESALDDADDSGNKMDLAAPVESKEDDDMGYDAWATSKGATPQTLERLQATKESQEREGGSAMNYRNLQNAACASEFVVRSVLQQKAKQRK